MSRLSKITVTSAFIPGISSVVDGGVDDSIFCQKPWKGSRNFPNGGMGFPPITQRLSRKYISENVMTRDRMNFRMRIGFGSRFELVRGPSGFKFEVRGSTLQSRTLSRLTTGSTWNFKPGTSNYSN